MSTRNELVAQQAVPLPDIYMSNYPFGSIITFFTVGSRASIISMARSNSFNDKRCEIS